MTDALTAWHELVENVNGRTVFGQDGVRDPDAPCDGFKNGKPGDGTCETDGHYLCMECVEMSLGAPRRRRDECEDCGTKLLPGTTSAALVACPECDSAQCSYDALKGYEQRKDPVRYG